LIFLAFLIKSDELSVPPFCMTMSTLTVELLNPKAKNILTGLEDAGLIAIDEPPKQWGTRSIMELTGLGAELWQDESADEYLRKERESWDF
jgi:hypothetical protein